jgi:beta-phosphoglucomutase family hydrolase
LFRGVVFDFDGVIVDSHPVHTRAWKKFLESVGKTASESQLQFVLDGRKREDILRHFLGELDPEQVVEYGVRKEQLFRDEAADVQTVEGLLDFLADLQDSQVVLGVASSASRSRVDFLLDRLDLKRYFRAVVTADEVEHGKPDPAVFLRAAHNLGLCPSELLAFEDAVSGVRAARSAGMKCIGIAQADRASTLLAAGATSVIPNFCCLSYSKLQHLSSNGLSSRSPGAFI